LQEGLIKKSSSHSSNRFIFPRPFRRRRLTTASSTDSSDYVVFSNNSGEKSGDPMLIMNSTERNKQSLSMLPPLPSFLNGTAKCDNMMMVSKNDNSTAPSSSSSDAAGPQMCVTLGPVPSSSS